MLHYFTDTSGLRPSESKKMFPEAREQSKVMEWRPTKRPLSEPGAHHYEKPEGLKVVESAPGKIFSIRERRHLRQHASKEEYSDRPLGPATVYRADGYRASDQIAQEVDISNELARKVRPLSLAEQRNGLGCRALGDKNYRHPEYETRFHHAGGLVVGSTFQRGSYAKHQARSETSITFATQQPRGEMKSFAEQERDREMAHHMNEVSGLTAKKGETADGQQSWESYALKGCEGADFEDLDSEDEGAVPADEGA